MLEGPPSYSVGKLPMHIPNLEVIHKNSKKGTEINLENKREERSVVEIIPPLPNKNARELWEGVRNFKDKDLNSLDSDPFSVMHLIGPLNLFRVPMPADTTQDDVDDCSQANTLETLLSYIGKTEAGIEILSFPLSRHLTPEAKDTLNLQAILAAPVTATLPLMDFLRVKPEMWAQVSRFLQNKGYACIRNLNTENNKEITANTSVQKLSLNKLNKYGKHRADKGNSMLPIQMGKVKTLAILDTGAGVSIATKLMWIKWGQLSLR